MKKFFTTFLLFTFCTVNLTFGALQIQEEAEQTELPKIEYKQINKNDKTLKKYNKKFKKYIKKAPKSDNEWFNPFYRNDNPVISDVWAKGDTIIKVALQDGDYAIDYRTKMFRNKKYAYEYHKDGSFMGYIEIKALKTEKNNITLGMFEYRFDEKMKVDDDGIVLGKRINAPYFRLKHILFMDLENTDNDPTKTVLAQFVYLSDGSLVCYQVGNTIYLAENARNLIPQLGEYDVKNVNLNKEAVKALAQVTGLSIMVAPVALVGAVVLLPFTPFFLFSFFDTLKSLP